MIYLSEKNKHGTYVVYWENGVNIGEFIIGDDGYYVYFPIQKYGYITSYFMRAIADKLDELNKDWDKIVRSDPLIK